MIKLHTRRLWHCPAAAGADDAHRVGVECLWRVRAVDARQRGARVVDACVQTAFALPRHLQGGLDGGVVGHVELREPGTELGLGRLCAIDAARPDADGVALLAQSVGSLAPESVPGRLVQGVSDGVTGTTGVVNRPGKCQVGSNRPLALLAPMMVDRAEHFL